MSTLKNAWATALEDSAPVAEFDIDVNEAPEIDTDEDGAPLEAVDAEGEPSFDAIETDMVEDEAEVEEAEAVAEKLEDTAVQLESAAVAIENRIANQGGMTNGELEFLMIGLEGRVKNTRSLFPSTESFGHSRLAASNEALESVKKGIAFIWKALRDAITAVMNKLRQWFGTVIKGAVKLKTRANGVIAAANRLTGEPITPKISLNKVQVFVGSGGKIATDGKSALHQLRALQGAVETTVGGDNTASWVQYINSYSNVLKDAMKAVEGKEFNEAELIGKITNIPGYANAGYNSKNTEQMNSRFSGVNAQASAEMPGGKRVFYMGLPGGTTPTTVEAFNEASKNRGMRLDSASAAAKAKSPATTEFTAMNKADIVAMAGIVDSIAGIIVNYQTSWSRRDKSVSDVQKAVDQSVKLVDAKKGEYAGDAKRQQALGSVLRSLSNEIKAAPKADAQFIQYALSTSNDFLLYCTRSLAAYKPAKEKKAKDEDTKVDAPAA